MQKHQAFASMGYPQQLMSQTHLWPHQFSIFWRLRAFFDIFDDVIGRNFRQWPQNYLYWKPLPLFDIWWKFEVTWASDAPSGLPYICKGSKNFFMGNWIELAILAVMSQLAVLISYFLWKKKLFSFFLYLIGSDRLPIEVFCKNTGLENLAWWDVSILSKKRDASILSNVVLVSLLSTLNIFRNLF